MLTVAVWPVLANVYLNSVIERITQLGLYIHGLVRNDIANTS